MAVHQSTGSSKRRKPAMVSRIHWGRKITYVLPSKSKVPVPIHENILCSRSSFFKEKLQAKRKPIDGDCSICCVAFVPEKDDLCHCRECGQNIHRRCIETWLNDKKSRNRCPFCRTSWVDDSKVQRIRFSFADPDAFDIYASWIYGNGVPTHRPDQDELEARYISLIKAWQFGDTVQDQEFKDAIIAQIGWETEDSDCLPGAPVMKYLFCKVTNPETDTLISFFIAVFSLKARSSENAWWEELQKDGKNKWVNRFINLLLKGLMGTLEASQTSARLDMAWIISRHTTADTGVNDCDAGSKTHEDGDDTIPSSPTIAQKKD